MRQEVLNVVRDRYEYLYRVLRKFRAANCKLIKCVLLRGRRFIHERFAKSNERLFWNGHLKRIYTQVFCNEKNSQSKTQTRKRSSTFNDPQRELKAFTRKDCRRDGRILDVHVWHILLERSV